MFKKTAVATLFVSVLAGCSSIPGMESATVDRNEMSTQLTKTCAELGSDYTPVSVAVDQVSKIMVSIQERQCSVFQDYRTLADKHADVAGFLAINADKSDEDLLVAMNAFDEGKPANKKIRPQVEAYKSASDSIFDKNVELAKDIAIETGKIAYIASQNATVLGQETALASLKNALSFASSSSEDENAEKEVVPVVEAYNELKARSVLAYDANEMISLDQNTIDQLENLDNVVAEQVKS
ncbi:hypothetical protein [Vibrio natriegens]|uniref:Lipoprotein n=1 Tax=Vibrio natriegens NBRC 15636 = ATCC 14048 = DSM 759 TaxID=1219067 RepID=A0AAN0Y7Z9_VIBNA|nr:hypothetical protein [Vibrio natriegens]ALR18816.1 hypothetical protein PN96_23280 [Vibrio natriegens NBRC 15636 = ATCC 14048 = DSM 759]ANQ14785.1 hypothetical protein BA890_18775 [Vibrio natriegens NBRC 15636 = ATCC 14048 = DSM 759]EPM39833.1 hypothetical protein M272_16555 [Vibrio natriegens NBRC 15636 = ATCC 14048 = DSM 759]MDX6029899.1 hypothetical protein [Vibrio natriegens NBRC 15636 = ATCC 14048 = DSM 759]UUI13422.1 hypothetical protein NP431_20580 [Vibrio natriegens]